MDERLQKQWQVTRALLTDAATQVSLVEGFSNYQEYVEHNELELALNVLVSLGELGSVNPSFWRNLKKAAEVMGLQSHYAGLRKKIHSARKAS